MTNTVCPRLLLMTQVQHFVSWIKKRQRRDVQTMWACDLDLWPWNDAQCSTCRGVPSCQFWWYHKYSLSIFGLLGVGARQWPGRDVIAIDLSANSNFCCLYCRNWQITVFWRQNSKFRKPFSKIYNVSALIRILRASLVQIDTEMAEKYTNHRYAASSHWKICRSMCVSINGPGDLDLWPFDLETGTRVASKVGNLQSDFG